MPSTGPAAGMRADGRRNRERILHAADQMFAEEGTEASLRDIARRSGIGIATLYRHFPTREALLEELLRARFEAQRLLAHRLADTEPPFGALVRWLGQLANGSRAYPGLPTAIIFAMGDATSELHEACVELRAAAEMLLRNAQDAGLVRRDLTSEELLELAVGVGWISDQTGRPEATISRLLDIAVRGIAPSDHL